MSEKAEMIEKLDGIVEYFLAKYASTEDKMALDDARVVANVQAWIQMQPDVVRCFECECNDTKKFGVCGVCSHGRIVKDENWFCGDGIRKQSLGDGGAE